MVQRYLPTLIVKFSYHFGHFNTPNNVVVKCRFYVSPSTLIGPGTETNIIRNARGRQGDKYRN